MRQRDQKHRPYQIKKTGIKDENIDRQILVIHNAIADKLISNPDLVEQVKIQLEHRKKLGRLNYSQYITWCCILELIDSPDRLRKAMLEDTPKMRKYRRNTPFVGILTEDERQSALSEFAIGEIVDVNNVIN